MGQEIELKFIGPEEALARLRDSPVLKRLAAGRRAKTRELKSIYFDTEEFALRDAGVALRVRDEGGGFVQTVKTIGGPDAATRTEVNTAVAGFAPDIRAISDKPLKRMIEKAARGCELKTIFIVEIQRTTIVLVPKRGTEIEAAFDVGYVRAVNGDTSEAPISEFELELLSGDVNELVSCAREVTAGVPLTLAWQSKAARGYALAGGAANAPVRTAMLVLPKKASASDAFGRIVGHCLHHLLGNWTAVVVARDPEGIHQMRVSIRRMRSVIALFGGPFRAALQPLEDDIRRLARVLGAARDLDVFEDEVFRPAAEVYGQDPRLDVLTGLVRAKRQKAWTDVISTLESDWFRGLMLDIAAATLSKPWRATASSAAGRPAKALARKRLARGLSQAIKLGKTIETLDVNERHTMRIRLKKLRYAVEFFASLYPEGKATKFVDGLGAIQDVLGHMNDAAVARKFTDEFVAVNHGDEAAVNYACGVIAGWHLGHDGEHRKTLSRQWRRFDKLTPPWK